jgi:hypothetical protein
MHKMTVIIHNSSIVLQFYKEWSDHKAHSQGRNDQQYCRRN